jgi:alcohol dehydrogenase (NADP+)
MGDYKFEGWIGHDESSVNGKMVWGEFEPKAWEETDVDIQVTHSGICGTDLHTLRSGWVSLMPPFNQTITDNFPGPG